MSSTTPSWVNLGINKPPVVNTRILKPHEYVHVRACLNRHLNHKDISDPSVARARLWLTPAWLHVARSLNGSARLQQELAMARAAFFEYILFLNILWSQVLDSSYEYSVLSKKPSGLKIMISWCRRMKKVENKRLQLTGAGASCDASAQLDSAPKWLDSMASRSRAEPRATLSDPYSEKARNLTMTCFQSEGSMNFFDTNAEKFLKLSSTSFDDVIKVHILGSDWVEVVTDTMDSTCLDDVDEQSFDNFFNTISSLKRLLKDSPGHRTDDSLK
ncbi:hypothetical protein K435DRAFT_814646, partial [Dendrothele bispora CBS 962.96]